MAKAENAEATNKTEKVAKATTKKATSKTTKGAATKTAKTTKTEKVTKTTVQSERIRIRLKAYDNVILDQSAEKIVDTAKRTGEKFQVLFHYQQKKK